MSVTFKLTVALIAGVSAFALSSQAGAWTPTKPIEFIATAGPGGGHGDPKQRPDAALKADMAAGYVTASEVYRP